LHAGCTGGRKLTQVLSAPAENLCMGTNVVPLVARCEVTPHSCCELHRTEGM
jgi:hypothetical protein